MVAWIRAVTVEMVRRGIILDTCEGRASKIYIYMTYNNFHRRDGGGDGSGGNASDGEQWGAMGSGR